MKATFAQLRALHLVLRHRGYAAAERATGVSRTTLHAGVKAAEQAYGCTFFERSPFQLTHRGHHALDVLDKVDRQVAEFEAEVERLRRPRLRILAAHLIAQDYLPGIIAALERRHPAVQCETGSMAEDQMREQVASGAMDCAIAPASPRWKGFSAQPLQPFPLALLAPPGARIAKAAELWAQSPVPFRLAIARSTTTLCEQFDRGLAQLGVTWDNRRQVDSLPSVVTSVARCGDFGLVVRHPALPVPEGVRVLPLPHFPALDLSVFWQGRTTPALATLLQLLGEAAGLAAAARA